MTPRFLLGSLVLLVLQACSHSAAPALQVPTEPSGGAVPSVPEPRPDNVEVRQDPALAVAADEGPQPACLEGEHVVGCALWRPRSAPHNLAMAVSGRSIGLAWTANGNGWVQSRGGPVLFQILDERLEPLRRVPLGGEEAHDVAVAAWRSGWVVAVSEGKRTTVRALDARGALRGPALEIEGGIAPHLAVSASGEVLLVRTVWTDHGLHTRAALLTDLAEPPLWDVAVVEQPTEPRFGSVVDVDGGFLVAQRGQAGVEVLFLDRQGRPGTRHQQVGSSTEYPKLASCGGDAAMTWSDFSSRGVMRWARLDGRGSVEAEPSELGGVPDYFDPSPGLCDRVGSIVLLGGYTGGTGVASHLELMRVDERGRSGERLAVLGGAQRAYDWRIDELDDDVVVAWIELHGSIGVARLRKPPTVEGGGLRQAR